MAAVNSRIINGTSPVAYTQAAVGDIAITNDKTFWILVDTPATNASNWKKLDVDSTDDAPIDFRREFTIPEIENLNGNPILLLPPLASNQYYRIIESVVGTKKAGTTDWQGDFDYIGIYSSVNGLGLSSEQMIYEMSVNMISNGGGAGGFEAPFQWATRMEFRNRDRNIGNSYGLWFGKSSAGQLSDGDCPLVVQFSYIVETIS